MMMKVIRRVKQNVGVDKNIIIAIILHLALRKESTSTRDITLPKDQLNTNEYLKEKHVSIYTQETLNGIM